MLELLANFRLQDALDIGIIAFIVYRIIDLIRGTRAARMLIGLFVVLLTYIASQFFDLYALHWILDNFLSSLLLVIVIIFQHDIRRALTQVGTRIGGERRWQGEDLEEIVRAVVTLASKRVGALIAFEREVGLSEYEEGATRLDARVSKEILWSIFSPTSPMHDGAVLVRRGRVSAAGCFLPLTANPSVSKTLGTRHRAAIGLTEETDAAVIVVSEEEGSISLVSGGRITRDLDAATLRATLQGLLTA
jgi:diadenylate cyclase